MKTITLLTAALLAAPLAAQAPDQGGESRIQVHAEFSRPRQVIIGQSGGNDVTDQASNQIGFGFRFMGEFPGANDWYYELGGRLQSSSKFDNKPTPANSNTDTTSVKFKYSYWTIGFARMWTMAPGMSLGAHLEARGESLNASGDYYSGNSGAQRVDVSTTYVRPWGRVSLDYSFKASGTSPFIGLDASVALLKASQDKSVPVTLWDDNTLKSQAPQISISVYAGIKF